MNGAKRFIDKSPTALKI